MNFEYVVDADGNKFESAEIKTTSPIVDDNYISILTGKGNSTEGEEWTYWAKFVLKEDEESIS